MKMTRSIFGWMILLLLLLPLNAAFAVQGVGADLYYMAPDGSNVMQVWMIGDDNVANALTTEVVNIKDYDVAYDGRLAYVTSGKLSVDGAALEAGGPLDAPDNVELGSVRWSPDASKLAVGAFDPSNPAGVSDPLEGLWIFDVAGQTWNHALVTTRADSATSQVYESAEWSPAGDQLMVRIAFAESDGLGLYSLNTGNLLTYDITGTGGFIDERGYDRGTWTPDGTTLIFSDVPVAATGNAFVVPVADFQKTTPLLPAEKASAFYLSHPRGIRGGEIYILRDFLNSATETQIWEMVNGQETPLGTIPTADVREVAWSGRGDALIYIDDFDGRTGVGHLMIRGAEGFQDATLPANVTRMINPHWGADFSPRPNAGQPSGLVFTEPLSDSSSGNTYAVQTQWNSVQGSTVYRLSVTPGINGQTSFDVDSTAARMGAMPCGTAYQISVAALDANGNPGTPSVTSNVYTPSCDSSAPPAAAQPEETQPPAPVETAEPGDVDAATTEEPLFAEGTPAAEATPEEPLPETVVTEEPEEPIGPSTVIDLAATEPAPGNQLADGTQLYQVDLTWSVPQEAFGLYLLNIDPPIGASQRAFFPVRTEEEATSAAITINDLVCSVQYTVRVQTMAADGSTVLATSPAITVIRPNCP